MALCAAVVQLKPDRGLEGNLESAAKWIDHACERGAGLVVLPENFAYFGIKRLAEAAAGEKTPDGPVRQFLRSKARQWGVWLQGGTVPIPDGRGERAAAAAMLYSPDGEEWARYDKIHLFDVDVEATGKSYRESDHYAPGDRIVVADTPLGSIGLSVCYDLRFPELYRRQVAEGARIFTVPSAFTATTGDAHWLLLLRARAVENLCFVLGADTVGRDDARNPTWGGSAIVDPWGKVLAQLDDEEGVAMADLDLARQERLRASMPALDHRRIFSV